MDTPLLKLKTTLSELKSVADRFKMSRDNECERCGEVETYSHLFWNVGKHKEFIKLLTTL